MTMPATKSHHLDRPARPGDWVHVRGISGQSTREGQIIEVLGRPGHERYRVRWDERHESILFPADGVTITGGGTHRDR
jgi:hypothetical protein